MNNKFMIMAIALGIMLGTVGCSKVPAGHRGIKVYLLGSAKGVDSEVLGVGRYFIGINEELYLFPVFTQNYTWVNDQAISFQTSEGLAVRADVGISYTIDPDKVHLVFEKYRRGVDEITDTYLRNMVRDSLNKRASELSVEDVYGKGKVGLIDSVFEDVTSQVNDIGIIIEKIYWIGEIDLPNTVKASLNAKIEATQMAMRRQNEVAQAKAEADKKIEEARGIAESMRITNQEVTDKVLRLRELEIQQQFLEKWNGVLPQTLFTSGENPISPSILLSKSN